MMPCVAIRRIGADERGTTLVEFGLVAPVMLLMVMGFFDLAHQAYASSILQGAMQEAARDSTLESGSTSAKSAAIDAFVEERVREVTGNAATFSSKRLSYYDFGSVGDPENFVDAAPLNGTYDLGECFEDVNGNGTWDSDLGKSGQGGAQDAVLYRMTVTYPRLFPMAGLLGWSEEQVISATTVLRNQPYGAQSKPVYAICT